MGRSTLSSSKLNGITSASPSWSSNLEKSTVWRKMRGGVPVFRRPVVKPRRLRLSVSPKAAASPSLPQGASNSPIKILPPKKVPVVRTMERASPLFSWD